MVASGLAVRFFGANQIDDVDVCASEDLVFVSVFGLTLQYHYCESLTPLHWVVDSPVFTPQSLQRLPAFEFGFVYAAIHVELL